MKATKDEMVPCLRKRCGDSFDRGSENVNTFNQPRSRPELKAIDSNKGKGKFPRLKLEEKSGDDGSILGIRQDQLGESDNREDDETNFQQKEAVDMLINEEGRSDGVKQMEEESESEGEDFIQNIKQNQAELDSFRQNILSGISTFF